MRAPVARFVAVVAVAATVLVLVAWSGSAAPAIDGQPLGSGTRQNSEIGYVLVEIANTGALPVDVARVTWPTQGLRDPHLFVGPVEGAPLDMQPLGPLGAFSLAGGERRALMVRGTIDCPLPGLEVTVASDPVEIVAKPAAGPSRTIELDVARPGQENEIALPCPPR